MSGRVLLFQHGFRPGQPPAARLVGERSDESAPAATETNIESAAAIRGLALWAAERLPRSAAGAPLLDILCVDVDGTLCSWLNSPSTEPAVVEGLVRQGAGDSESTQDLVGSVAGLPHESAVQALAPVRPSVRTKRGAPPPERSRLPILVVQDAAARLLQDDLDSLGVRVGTVTTLWHAIASAWDPAGVKIEPRSPSEREAVVADDSPVHASVAIDPMGRLLWAWSHGGRLVAAGQVRLRVDPDGGVIVSAPDIARVGAAWMSWSVQFSAAPARVTCITPPLERAGLDARALGETLGRAWPGAAIDLAVDEDPIGATLRRLAVASTNAQEANAGPALSPDDPRASLLSLTRRPGRAHQRLYLWASMALVALALGVGALAAGFWIEAARVGRSATQTSDTWRNKFKELAIAGTFPPGGEFLALQTEVSRLTRQSAPPENADPAMPVLEELETLSLVLGSEEIEVDEILLDSRFATNRVVVRVADLATAESVLKSLNSIAGSRLVDWQAPSSYPSVDKKLKGVFTAKWADSAKPGT